MHLSTEIQRLFADISQGKKEAFDTLFRKCYARLVNFAVFYLNETSLAEEVAADVFMALWQNRVSLCEVEKPENYLYIATKNRCLNVLRKNSIAKISVDEQPYLQNHLSENASEDLEHRELHAKLNALVEALPEQRRLIFKMIKEDEFTARQTAEILHLSFRTVESQIYKAVKTLEEEITAYLGYSPRKRKLPKSHLGEFLAMLL